MILPSIRLKFLSRLIRDGVKDNLPLRKRATAVHASWRRPRTPDLKRNAGARPGSNDLPVFAILLANRREKSGPIRPRLNRFLHSE